MLCIYCTNLFIILSILYNKFAAQFVHILFKQKLIYFYCFNQVLNIFFLFPDLISFQIYWTGHSATPFHINFTPGLLRSIQTTIIIFSVLLKEFVKKKYVSTSKIITRFCPVSVSVCEF
jgi:hypothetical protein